MEPSSSLDQLGQPVQEAGERGILCGLLPVRGPERRYYESGDVDVPSYPVALVQPCNCLSLWVPICQHPRMAGPPHQMRPPKGLGEHPAWGALTTAPGLGATATAVPVRGHREAQRSARRAVAPGCPPSPPPPLTRVFPTVGGVLQFPFHSRRDGHPAFWRPASDVLILLAETVLFSFSFLISKYVVSLQNFIFQNLLKSPLFLQSAVSIYFIVSIPT